MDRIAPRDRGTTTIVSFAEKATEALFHGRFSRDSKRIPSDIARTAVRKLDMLNAAKSLVDLRSPPANRLELLRGDLAGRFSIRVNDQWRIVFRWEGADAHDVARMDYH